MFIFCSFTFLNTFCRVYPLSGQALQLYRRIQCFSAELFGTTHFLISFFSFLFSFSFSFFIGCFCFFTNFFFGISSNLDPFDQYHDAEIWDVLESIQMRSAIEKMPENLRTSIVESTYFLFFFDF
jgi:hypothetical protein